MSEKGIINKHQHQYSLNRENCLVHNVSIPPPTHPHTVYFMQAYLLLLMLLLLYILIYVKYQLYGLGMSFILSCIDCSQEKSPTFSQFNICIYLSFDSYQWRCICHNYVFNFDIIKQRCHLFSFQKYFFFDKIMMSIIILPK